MHGYHNAITHSPVAGLIAATIVALGARLIGRGRSALWFGLTLACCELHVLLDYFTFGRGIM